MSETTNTSTYYDPYASTASTDQTADVYPNDPYADPYAPSSEADTDAYASSYDDTDYDPTEPTGDSSEPVESDDALSMLDDIEESTATEEDVTAEEAAPLDNTVLFDNQANFEIDFEQGSNGAPYKAQVILPQNSSDEHYLKLNGIPPNYTVSVVPGSAADSIIIYVKNEKGEIVSQYQVDQLAGNYVQLSGGKGPISIDPAVSSEIADSIYFNTEPAETVVDTLVDGTETTLNADALSNENHYTYTIEDDVTLKLNLPDNTTYTAKSVKESDGTYTLTLEFFDTSGKKLSTVVLKDPKGDIENIDAMTHLTVTGATLQNASSITDTEMQLVLGLTTVEDLGYVVRDGVNLGIPDESVKKLSETTGSSTDTIYDTYLYNPEIGKDRDGDGVITFADVSKYLAEASGKAPDAALIGFMEALDPELAKLHQAVYDHVADEHNVKKRKDDGDTAGEDDHKNWTAETANSEYLKAQEAYRDRLVKDLKTLYGDKISIGKAETITLKQKGAKNWKVDSGSGVDNIVYKGKDGNVTLDLIDLNSGEISLTAATQEDDFYAWSYVDSSKTDAVEAAKNGAMAGAALGAIIGTCIEPGVGTVVGAAIGAVVGGVAGAVKENGAQGVKDVAEAIWDWF